MERIPLLSNLEKLSNVDFVCASEHQLTGLRAHSALFVGLYINSITPRASLVQCNHVLTADSVHETDTAQYWIRLLT